MMLPKHALGVYECVFKKLLLYCKKQKAEVNNKSIAKWTVYKS